ncbi:DUF1838 domain-containing protein [Synechococcus sp. PCC 6716]|nr:DUF1838 domain-containing protein [Synechococcus sp. PCC 6716]
METATAESRQEWVTARDWVRVRADLAGDTTFMVWQGAVYSFVPQEPRRHLFNIVGMSAARCVPHPESGWYFLSRELTFYLDPETNTVGDRWRNPWTQEVLTVIPVANDPVQGLFRREVPAQVRATTTTFQFDLFPYYANPLASDPRFGEYSPQPLYQAVELFKLTVATADLNDQGSSTIRDVQLYWSRIGPWLPWMKMGDRPGYLIYSASGQKAFEVAALPRLLQEQLQRLPHYCEAPTTYRDGADMTSWLYFQEHFEAYLAGETFPL